MLSDKPFIVIDLYSGAYTNKRIGHEELNFEWNASAQKYLGYCPPYNNIVIQRLGASRNDRYVQNVLVIYVRKLRNTSNREIIGFSDNATIYRPGIDGKNSGGRSFIDKDGSVQYCGYCIESDTLYDLRSLPLHDKFIIRIADYSSNMFRKQRFYKGTYEKLDKKILEYLENYLKYSTRDEDFSEQESIQKASLPKDGGVGSSRKEPLYGSGNVGRVVHKRHELAKQVLKNADYKCEVCSDHKTFLTSHGVPYMEGHQLIPCTPSNSQYFWEKYCVNIDCIENIVSLCPNCHRRIHFGSSKEKREVIETLYELKKAVLEDAGIIIGIEDLMKLYQ